MIHACVAVDLPFSFLLQLSVYADRNKIQRFAFMIVLCNSCYCFCFRTQNRDMRVIVGSKLQCMLGNKPKTVSVETGAKNEAHFRKASDQLILSWP